MESQIREEGNDGIEKESGTWKGDRINHKSV